MPPVNFQLLHVGPSFLTRDGTWALCIRSRVLASGPSGKFPKLFTVHGISQARVLEYSLLSMLIDYKFIVGLKTGTKKERRREHSQSKDMDACTFIYWASLVA